MIPGPIVTSSKLKFCTKGTQLSSKQLCLNYEKRTKQAETSVEQRDKEKYNYISKTEINVRKCCGKIQGKLNTGDHNQKDF